MLRHIALFLLAVTQLAHSQSPNIVVCIPGRCLQGTSNVSIGAKFEVSGNPPLRLLPGQYTRETGPQYLRDIITHPSVSISPSAGFPDNKTLPLNIQLSPGLAIYTLPLYSGTSAFTDIPNIPVTDDYSVPLTAQSLALSGDTVATISSSSSQQILIHDSIPHFSELPSELKRPLSLRNLESLSCSQPCSSGGICGASGTCQCSPNFTGPSCESCAPGFFGPTCKPCPADCDSCDEGITGSGRCLKPPTPSNAPSKCNCQNGVCDPSTNACLCTPGFTTGDDGLQCSECAQGFFQTSTGDCKRCSEGCASCEASTGRCLSCLPRFAFSSSDSTKCQPITQSTGTGALCPDGTFPNPNGSGCTECSSACNTCFGPSDGECSTCPRGRFFSLDNKCVGTTQDGICQGTDLMADTLKRKCDACGAKCTSCRFPSFSAGSLPEQRQCTSCIPGYVLSNGACVESCPRGTFLPLSSNPNDTDTPTCQPCSGPCTSCSGSATFCTTCSNSQLAISSTGKCTATCPKGTFLSQDTGTCEQCHPDCAECSGPSFGECTSCSTRRPILSVQGSASQGRCLPYCPKSTYFNSSTSKCEPCANGCATCSGPSSSQCLSCSNGKSELLRGGTCVPATCASSQAVLEGLGVCLEHLVIVPPSPSPSDPNTDTGDSDDTEEAPMPTFSAGTKKFKFEWWQILLLALGCALLLILLILFILWLRRRARQRQKGNFSDRVAYLHAGGDEDGKVLYAVGTDDNKKGTWRNKLIIWAHSLFSSRPRRVREVEYEYDDFVGGSGSSTKRKTRKFGWWKKTSTSNSTPKLGSRNLNESQEDLYPSSRKYQDEHTEDTKYRQAEEDPYESFKLSELHAVESFRMSQLRASEPAKRSQTSLTMGAPVQRFNGSQTNFAGFGSRMRSGAPLPRRSSNPPLQSIPHNVSEADYLGEGEDVDLVELIGGYNTPTSNPDAAVKGIPNPFMSPTSTTQTFPSTTSTSYTVVGSPRMGYVKAEKKNTGSIYSHSPLSSFSSQQPSQHPKYLDSYGILPLRSPGPSRSHTPPVNGLASSLPILPSSGPGTDGGLAAPVRSERPTSGLSYMSLPAADLFTSPPTSYTPPSHTPSTFTPKGTPPTRPARPSSGLSFISDAPLPIISTSVQLHKPPPHPAQTPLPNSIRHSIDSDTSSLYSQMTGMQRKTPEPRLALRGVRDTTAAAGSSTPTPPGLGSKFSVETLSTVDQKKSRKDKESGNGRVKGLWKF